MAIDAQNEKKKPEQHSDATAANSHDASADVAKKLHDDASKKVEATPVATKPVDWRDELKQAADGMNKLKEMHGQDPHTAHERAQLIKSIDKNFQHALPLMRVDAESSDENLLKSVAKASASKEDFDKFNAGHQLIDPNKTSMDQIHNAILNAPDEGTRKKLTHLAMLSQTATLASAQVDDSYYKTKAIMFGSLDYADFLVRYKDGISKGKDGQAFTAGDVLMSGMSRELATSPMGKNLLQLANDSNVSHQNLLIPSEKNPVLILNHLMANEGNAKDRLDRLKHANALAQDKYFDPENLQQEITKAKNDQSPEGLQKLAALQTFTHVRGATESYLASVESNNQKPNNGEVVDHLLKAAKDDPTSALQMRYGNNGEIFPNALVKALSNGTPELANTSQRLSEERAKLEKLMSSDVSPKHPKSDKQKAADLHEADKLANYAVADAKRIRDLIGPENAKKIDEELQVFKKKFDSHEQLSPQEKVIASTLADVSYAYHHAPADVMFQRAAVDMGLNNHNAAVAQLQDIQKMGPDAIGDPTKKALLPDMMAEAKKDADYDNSSWFSKRCTDAMNILKNNEKWVAAGTGFVVGVGTAAILTTSTFGFGAPAAIAAGFAAGAIAGDFVGAKLEQSSGRNKDFWKAAGDVAPMAIGGAATGALIGAGGAAAVFGLGTTGAEGAELSFGARLAMQIGSGAITAAPLSLANTAENVKSGKDRTLGAAALDAATADASWALAGAFGSARLFVNPASNFFLRGLQKSAAFVPNLALNIGANLATQNYYEKANDYLNRGPLQFRIQKDSLNLPASAIMKPSDEVSDQ